MLEDSEHIVVGDDVAGIVASIIHLSWFVAPFRRWLSNLSWFVKSESSEKLMWFTLAMVRPTLKSPDHQDFLKKCDVLLAR